MRLGGLDDLEPVAAGAAVLVGDDLHRIAALERRIQRHQLAVDLRAHALAAHLRVDEEGEVQRGRALGEFLHVSGGREDVHFVLEQVHAQGVHEFLGVGFLPLPVDDLAEPFELGGVLDVHRVVPFLVQPVRSHSVFGQPVHLLRAYLDFDALALGPDHRRVQALVPVGLGHGDVVLEAARNRLPLGMDEAEHGVAVAHVLDDGPEGEDVVHIVERQVLLGHLFIDAVDMLDAAPDRAFDLVGAEDALQLGDDLGDELALHHLIAFQPVGNLGVDVRMDVFEAESFQLQLDAVQAETVGEGHVDVHRLLRDALPLVRLLEIERPHVVHAVRQFDDGHPDVVRHGEDHLADVLGLLLLLAVEGHHADLGHAVHDVGDLFPELGIDLFKRHLRVFHRVVQQPGGHRVGVEPEFRQNLRHRQRVGKIRLPGKPHLPGVGGGGVGVGFADERLLGFRGVGGQSAQNVLHRQGKMGGRSFNCTHGSSCGLMVNPDRRCCATVYKL